MKQENGQTTFDTVVPHTEAEREDARYERVSTVLLLREHQSGGSWEPARLLEYAREVNERFDTPLPDRRVQGAVLKVLRVRDREEEPVWPWRKLPEEYAVFTLSEAARRFAPHSTDWLLKEWLPDESVLLVAGPPGSWKTWLLLDLAQSVATGDDFLGQVPVSRTGEVLLLQQEDHLHQLHTRLLTIHLGKRGLTFDPDTGGDTVELEFSETEQLDQILVHPYRMFRFDDPQAFEWLADLVSLHRPALVVLDPLYSAASAEDFMASAAEHALPLKTLRDRFGTTFAIGHHVRKSDIDSTERRRTWGSEFIDAFSETQWQVRPGDSSSEVFVRRYHKAAAGEEEVALRFDVDTGEPPRYDVELGAPRGDVTEEERTLEDRVLEFVKANPGCSASALEDGVTGRAEDVRRARDKLLAQGRLQDKRASSHVGSGYSLVAPDEAALPLPPGNDEQEEQ